VLDYYITPPVVSPRFGQDHTVIIGRESGPLYFSEDAGDTWFPLWGIPTVGAYGRKYGLDIAYHGDLLFPIASAPDGVYTYQWPQLSPVAAVYEGAEQGSSSPIDVLRPLEAGDRIAAPWETGEDADWLSITPPSGTLPSTLTLTVDPSGVSSTVETQLSIDVYWSLYQNQTITVPVELFFFTHRVWLPLIHR
jgi:hypothetical protein